MTHQVSSIIFNSSRRATQHAGAAFLSGRHANEEVDLFSACRWVSRIFSSKTDPQKFPQNSRKWEVLEFDSECIWELDCWFLNIITFLVIGPAANCLTHSCGPRSIAAATDASTRASWKNTWNSHWFWFSWVHHISTWKKKKHPCIFKWCFTWVLYCLFWENLLVMRWLRCNKFQPHRCQHDLEERPVDVGDLHHLQGRKLRCSYLLVPLGTSKVNTRKRHLKPSRSKSACIGYSYNAYVYIYMCV